MAAERDSQSKDRFSPSRLYKTVIRNNVTTVEGFLKMLPESLRSNMIFIEKSGNDHNTASINYPRVFLFSPNARLLMTYNSNPEDVNYEEVDLAHLNSKGFWKPAIISFKTGKAILRKGRKVNNECGQCHSGGIHGGHWKPVWGGYLKWEGIFGNTLNSNNKMGEMLSEKQANKVNEILTHRNNIGPPDSRFSMLNFYETHYQAGNSFRLKNRYPFALAISNLEIGNRQVDSIVQRFRNHPDYDKKREELLFSHICTNHEAYSRLDSVLINADITEEQHNGRKKLKSFAIWRTLDVKAEEVLTLGQLSCNLLPGLAPDAAYREDLTIADGCQTGNYVSPNYGWFTGSDRLTTLVAARVLLDLAFDDDHVFDILESTKIQESYKKNFLILANNTLMFLAQEIYKTTIEASLKHELEQIGYYTKPKNVHHFIFAEVENQLCNYLADNLDLSQTVKASPVSKGRKLLDRSEVFRRVGKSQGKYMD